MKELYAQLGISSAVYDFGKSVEDSLKERFEKFDKTAEYNQMKVIQIVFNACCGVILALLAFFSGWRWLPWTIRRVAARKERRAAKRLAKKAAKA